MARQFWLCDHDPEQYCDECRPVVSKKDYAHLEWHPESLDQEEVIC